MIRFQHPELALLALPVGWLFFRYAWKNNATGWVRLLLLCCLLLAITGPRINVAGEGVDVVVVIDRSRSLPTGASASMSELLENLQQNRGEGDRIGVVTFGGEVAIEQALSERKTIENFARDVPIDGSDLNDALHKALDLIDPDRPARILVLSDGEANGISPTSAARRAREAGVPIDFRIYERQHVGDAAIESVQLPEEVAPREPFQYSVLVHSDRATRGVLRVKRDGEVISEVTREFPIGTSPVVLRDLLEQGGFYNYEAELEIEGDPIRQNNNGLGLVRVDAGPKALFLTDSPEVGNMQRALKAARIPFDVASPKTFPLTQDALDPYRAVIVENAPAGHFGRLKMEQLAQYVEDLGGGLLLTGGQRSFGAGGYFNSPLDPILPVSMELREEHRKMRIALAVVLDRSGSMSMPAGGGKTKMDLANIGTAECVRMLSPSDMVTVIAVDSEPHIVEPLTKVSDPEGIANRALRIESMGGGIYVYEALVAAGRELQKAEDYSTRHIILFSDAQDSEEPGNYKKLLEQYERAGITVSVIGLGRDTDVDAQLLKDIAKRGNGNVMFTVDPQELPRLFTEDTMSVARSTFIEAEDPFLGIGGNLVPDIKLLGDVPSIAFPSVGGYNLCYMKPKATIGVITEDEYEAPLSAFWFRGLGRVAALTLEVDGQFSGEFASWPAYEDFLITHARWLLGSKNPNEVFVEIAQAGQDAIVNVELDPNRTGDLSAAPELIVVPPGEGRSERLTPEFVWSGPHSLQARFKMDRVGSYRTIVKTGPQAFSRGPALTLPYSPEFTPRVGLPTGSELLSEVSELSGGEERTDVLEVFANPPRSAKSIFILPYLMIAALVLLLLEIAGRRLNLWDFLKRTDRPQLAAAGGVPVGNTAPQKKARWLPEFRLKRNKSKTRKSDVDMDSEPDAKSAPEPAPAPEPKRSQADIFRAAKNRAKKRHGE